jgi:hypothetical protein
MADLPPQDPTAGKPDAGQQVALADDTQQHPGGVPPEAVSTQSLASEPVGPTANTTYIYAVIAIGLGILFGLAFALIALRPNGRSNPNDLGSVVSNADGLTGHLILNWTDKLHYHLVVEPSDPLKLAQFSLAVSNPPRPLSFDIELKDATGSALCNRTILSKFDPKQAAAFAASNGAPQDGAEDAGQASFGQIAQGVDIAKAEAAELKREYGQDIFQNAIGPDGQTDSISSQGDIPCSRQAYDRATSWSFSPDFPTLDEQAALLNRQAAANNPTDEASADKTPAPHRRAKKKPPAPLTAFAIEGDDELVGVDASKGIIETSTRKFFVIDKLTAADNSAVWQDVPANVHYKCDLNAVCSLKRAGAMVVYARLRR